VKTRFSQKTRFSAHGTSHAASPVICSSKAFSEEQRTIVSRRWCMQCNGHVFRPLHPEHDFGFASMMSWQAKSQQTAQQSQQTVQLARRFFTQKHRPTQQREDCAEDLELNLSQMLHAFWLHSKACNFHLQTTQKACSFWRSAILTMMKFALHTQLNAVDKKECQQERQPSTKNRF